MTGSKANGRARRSRWTPCVVDAVGGLEPWHPPLVEWVTPPHEHHHVYIDSPMPFLTRVYCPGCWRLERAVY